jgi:hypothetical protein
MSRGSWMGKRWEMAVRVRLARVFLESNPCLYSPTRTRACAEPEVMLDGSRPKRRAANVLGHTLAQRAPIKSLGVLDVPRIP